MTIRAEKQGLRRATRARILALDPVERGRQAALLRDAFPTLPGLGSAGTVLLYVTAFPEEVDTQPYVDWVRREGRRLVLPRVDRDAWCLRLHAIDDPARDLAAGTLGILEPQRDAPAIEPQAVDWVLVPGLAFDPRGYRLGRGAGHYDRLLPQLRPDVRRWAVALEPQAVETLPVEPHDVPLDGVLFPSRRSGPRPE